MIVEQALRHPSLGRAAAVVVDPNNGEILGMGSVPSFDPNVFIPSISTKDWEVLNKDEAVPLVNRAVSGFPPGSTFKIITALAGLTRRTWPATISTAPAASRYGDHDFHCWIAEKHGSHGTLGLADALKVSCDCFFYQYGNDGERSRRSINVGSAAWASGKSTTSAFRTRRTAACRARTGCGCGTRRRSGAPAYTANVSIGQGYVLASPLQMAMAYVAVANGGIAYEPRLVKKVLDARGRAGAGEPCWTRTATSPCRISRRSAPISASGHPGADRHGAPAASGKWSTIPAARAAKARLKNIIVAGKTGSAQATDRGKKDTIAWFCSFRAVR